MEQYVKRFQRFHAGEDVRPVTSCKFLLNYWLDLFEVYFLESFNYKLRKSISPIDVFYRLSSAPI